MAKSTVQTRGQVTIPKSVREEAAVAPGDIVDIRADGMHKVIIEVIPVKPLDYFWEKFARDEPYDDDAIRSEWQDVAAAEAIGE
ncbi:MAG: AbrB/MazE/SpoVT family DNA-binding domain-containing protein [Thermomicrobiales bacterium]|nr:AbrB/MazE/SpoVT family DNA-binding domain-containing protein [Thermomicrobiales bacterium]